MKYVNIEQLAINTSAKHLAAFKWHLSKNAQAVSFCFTWKTSSSEFAPNHFQLDVQHIVFTT